MNKPETSYTISMKGTFTKTDGVWKVEIPAADFVVNGQSILNCLSELDRFIEATSDNQKIKFKVKIHNGGHFTVSSSDYKAFIDFITKRLILNPNPEDIIKSLIDGISIDIGF